MNTVDQSVEQSYEINSREDDEVKGVPEERPVNDTRTNVGNPLRYLYPPLCLHRGRDRVTGSGTGPTFRNSGRESQSDGRMHQMMVRMPATKKADYTLKPNYRGGALTEGANLSDGTVQHPGAVRDMHPQIAWGPFGTGNIQQERTIPYQIGERARAFAGHNPWTMAADQGWLPGGLAMGVTTAGVGALGSWLWNKFLAKKDKDKVDVGRYALLSGLAGAGLGALSGYHRSRHAPGGRIRRQQQQVGWDEYQNMTPAERAPIQQQAEQRYGMTKSQHVKSAASLYDPRSQLLSDIGSAGLPWSLVQRLVVAIQNLSDYEAQDLRRFLGGLTGTALGVAAARKLGLGGGMQMGLGLASGLVTSNLFGRVGNPRGQVVTDLYGNSYGTPFY